MSIMENRFQAITVTKDEGFAAQFESALSSVVTSTRHMTEKDMLHEILNEHSIVILDIRQSEQNLNSLISHLKRTGNGASVLVVAPDKDPDAVLDSFRAGASDYLAYPAETHEIAEAARRIVNQGSDGVMLGRTIAVFSLKGGQGVTSLAANLVDHIHTLTGESCLLTDLNLYMGHAGLSLDLPCRYTPFDLVNDLDRADDNLLFSSLVRHERGFHVLGISDHAADASQISSQEIGKMLRLLHHHLQYNVLDLPHDLSGLTLAGLDVADQILLVVQQDVPSLKNAQIALRVFTDLNYDLDGIRILVNRYVKRNDIDIQDIEQTLKRPVFATIRNDFATISTTYNRGQTVGMSTGKSRLNQDFMKLAELVTGVPSLQDNQRSWFRRLPFLEYLRSRA